MCTTTKQTPVRLETSARVFLKGARSPIYLAEPSFEAVQATVDQAAQSGLGAIVGVTTGAAPIRIDATLVETVLAEPDADKLAKRREALEAQAQAERALADPELDLTPGTTYRLQMNGATVSVLTEEPLQSGDFVEVLTVNLANGDRAFVNPAFEGDLEKLVAGVRMIATEEQRHIDALTAEAQQVGFGTEGIPAE